MLERILTEVSRGAKNKKDLLLKLVARTVLYVPVSSMIVDSEISGGEKISSCKVLTFKQKSRRVVPAFITEKDYLSWSHGRFKSITLCGGDLAVALPAPTWLLLNAGLPNKLELSPDDLLLISEMNLDDDLDPNDERAFNDILENMKEDLVSLFSSIQGIEEAYLYVDNVIDSMDAISGLSLGILVSNISDDSRFIMIDEIAEISKEYFSEGDFIEVFDDLANPSSKSWELFCALTPFYVRERVNTSDYNEDVKELWYDSKGLKINYHHNHKLDKQEGFLRKILNKVMKLIE